MSAPEPKEASPVPGLSGTIGSRIREARKEAGLNQTDLAERLHVSQPTVANWEAGAHDPRQLTLAKIADVLSVSIWWLSSGERSALERDKSPAAAYLRRALRHVPVINLGETRPFLEDVTLDPHILAIDYIPVTYSASDRLFCFFYGDEAMNLVFSGETLVVIDYSARDPRSGDFVLYAPEDGKAPVVRRWREKPCRLEPCSSVPGHEVMFVEDRQHVIGTVQAGIRIF